MAAENKVDRLETLRRDALESIEKLVAFAHAKGLIDGYDTAYARNGLIDLIGCDSPFDGEIAPFDIPDTATALLKPITDYACAAGIAEDDNTSRDLFETRAMGMVTPSPAETRMRFEEIYNAQGAKAATDWFYDMCCACNYIQVDRVAKNIRYFADSPVGELEITINLSKPEKDPKEIAKLKNAPSVGYPRCMLCVENPGYAGRANFPARQNHRMVPVTLGGEQWYMQYSPYKYYEEHCIVLCGEHRPMKIERGSFERLADFVEKFPHYFIGSNADLPIVGGSILNHDHFQGGHYEFAMAKAPVEKKWVFPGFEDVDAGIVHWPMSCIRLTSEDDARLVELADKILTAWRGYSDEKCFIFAETDGEPHNTITPIARMRDGKYQLDLVLRNNITTPEHPLGVFHPHAKLHHIKKENIGLIEVMGLAVLPSRLKKELFELADALVARTPVSQYPEELQKHAEWAEDILARHPELNGDTVHLILQDEVGHVFAQVLADAGVYKMDEAGRAGFVRFLASVQ